jgi:hypothetical protein
LDTTSNSSSLSPANKVLQSETGKFITKKAFSWLENRVKRSKFSKEAEHILQSIFVPGDKNASHKYHDKYLCFRMISSANDDVFIGDIYHPINLSNKSQANRFTEYKLSDIFYKNNITCLIGRAGQGKTTALRKVILEILQSPREPSFIPFIIQLRDVEWEKDGCITKLLAKELTYFGFSITEEQSAYLLQEGVVKILFDGFDEVESKYYQLASKVINETYSRYNTSCIVTTRPNTPIAYASNHTTNYHLLDLTISDVTSIIKKYKNLDDKYKENLIKTVERSDSISKILISPVMVDIFIYVYPELLEEPKSIIDFYRPLFDFITSKHDRLKGAWKRDTVSGTSNLELKTIFSALSFHSIAAESAISVDETQLIKLCSKALNTIAKSNLSPEKVVEDILQRTSLIQEDGLLYSYIHKSICEYYAAEFVRDLPDPSKIKFYEQLAISNQEKFKTVLSFLSEIDSPFFYTYYARKCLELSQYERNRHHTEIQNWHIAVFTSLSEVKFPLKPNGDISLKFASESKSEGESLFYLLEVLRLDFPDINNDLTKTLTSINPKTLIETKSDLLKIDITKSFYTVSCKDFLSEKPNTLRKWASQLDKLYAKLDNIRQQNDHYNEHLNGKINLIDEIFTI